MTKFIGRLSELGIGRETVRGTVVPAGLWVPKVDNKFDVKTDFRRSKASYGNINLEGANAYPVQKWAEGSLELDMDDQVLGYLLYSVLGACSSSSVADSAYTHTFTVLNSNQHPTLSVFVKDNDVSTRVFRMAMVSAIKFECKTAELVKVTADIVSKSERDYSAVTPTYVAQNKFVGRDVGLYLATAVAGLAGASVIRPKGITFSIIQNAKPDFGLGTADPVDIYNQAFSIEGEIELNYAEETYKDLMLNGTYNAMRIKIQSSTLIGTSSVPVFTLDLSRCSFESWEPTRANDELATQKIQFRALYDTTNSNVINSCTLINAKVSY